VSVVCFSIGPSSAPAATAPLTVIAGNLYRLLARGLPRYERATPDRIWRHFLNATGTLHTTDDTITVDLRLRAYHPVLIDAGLADQTTPIPWLDDRQLRFRFPPPLNLSTTI
jgi:hypothetical protein